MQKVPLNKTVKFHVKIPNGCWENGEKLLGGYFFCCTWYMI